MWKTISVWLSVLSNAKFYLLFGAMHNHTPTISQFPKNQIHNDHIYNSHVSEALMNLFVLNLRGGQGVVITYMFI